MSEIVFGVFECVGKNHVVNKKGRKTFKVKFEDEYENRLTVVVDESGFKHFEPGDALPWQIVKRQSTLREAER